MLINVGPEEGVDVIGAETEIIDKAKSDGQLSVGSGSFGAAAPGTR